MPKQLPMLFVTIATVITAFFSAGTASADEIAFLSLRGQKSGQMSGDTRSSSFKDQFDLRNFSVTPATPATGPVTLSGTISYYGLARVFNSMVSNELITEAIVTVERADRYGALTPEFTVRFANAYFTDLSFDFAQGLEPVFSFKLTTATNSAVRYASPNGTQLTTAIPSIAGPALAKRATPTFSAKLKTSAGGTINSPIQEISWHATAPGNGVGKPVLTSLMLTRAPDASSTALKSAAARGDSLSGTEIDCMSTVPPSAATVRIFAIQLGSAKLAPPLAARSAGSSPTAPVAPTVMIAKGAATSETYAVELVTPPPTGHEITLEVQPNATVASY